MRKPTTERLDGLTTLITGANTGIGRTAALELARRGSKVIVAARTVARAQPVVDEVTRAGGKGEPWALELSDLEAVGRSAEALVARGEPIHRLILNAGVAGQRGLTSQGFELTFGVNHLAHLLFGEIVLPPLLRAHGPMRVVVVSSGNHYVTKRVVLDAVRERTQTTTGLREYSMSKLANVMTMLDWCALQGSQGLTACALNPGRVASDIWRRIPQPFRWLFMQTMRTAEQGAYTTVHCAALPDARFESGAYYNDCVTRPFNPVASDPEERRALREASLAWIAPYRPA